MTWSRVTPRGSAAAEAKRAGTSSGMAASFPIAGIGASAGGLESFARLLAELPLDSGMAFVLVQHLDPTHDSKLTELLARSTKLPVREVRRAVKVEPNQVYVIPP